MNKKLIILGSDKISNLYEKKLYKYKDIIIVRDVSANIKRALKLFIKRSIKLDALIKISYANILRNKTKVDADIKKIRNNAEILDICKKENINRIILFRCALIIKPKLFNSKIQLVNIHCSDLPSYPGLGAIHRAIKNKDFEQNACAHIITNHIDGGEILHKMKYTLDPKKTYIENENLAYETGYKLLIKYLI